MNPVTVVVATRSRHKLREILQMLPPLDLRFVTLDDAGVHPSPDEDEIEIHESFEENARAKARYFSRLCRRPVLADDSGLCVDALGGAPGVRSKRYSARADLSGADLDEANNRRLLDELEDVPEPRTARYVCAIAIATPDGYETVATGSVEGRITIRPAGDGGFGYDPLFLVPELNATFAEVPADVKNRLSHRRRALERALPALRSLALRQAPDHRAS